MNREIVNLSLSPLTRDLRVLGVFDLPTNDVLKLNELLLFGQQVPSEHELRARAEQLAALAGYTGAEKALIKPPSFFAFELERALRERGIKPVHAYGMLKPYYTKKQGGDRALRAHYHLCGLVSSAGA